MPKFDDIDTTKLGHTIQLAGTLYTGEGKSYVFLLPGESIQGTVEAVPMELDEWTRFNKTLDYLETQILTRAADGTLAKVMFRKSQRQIDKETSWRVFRRDGCRCRYCGTDKRALTVDHLIPWEDSGPPTENNLVASCRRCNKDRGNMPLAEWLQSDTYHKVSVSLTQAQHEANVALVPTLDRIPRLIHKRSRNTDN